jgi:predicted RNA-binding Zn-ribbon protein involved in translation (DUF1610 family)
MTGHDVCRSCGSQLTHLQGVTGHVSTCPRCGWGRLELTRDERTMTTGVGFVRFLVAQQDKVVGKP